MTDTASTQERKEVTELYERLNPTQRKVFESYVNMIAALLENMLTEAKSG